MAELEGPEQRRRRGFRLTAKYQVSGWRFLYRRLQHALVRRDTRMIDDPQRQQASPLVLGIGLGVVVCIGAVVLGLFSPAGQVKDAKIVANKDTGALYVRVGDRLDPVTNLTSARLIIGQPDSPVRASAAEIDKYPKGSLVGIPGAPNDIRDTQDPWSVWTVCDTTMTGAAVPLDPVSGLPTTARSPVTTTAIGGPLTKGADTATIDGNQARLVGYDNRTWLIYSRPDGAVVRSTVDITDPIVADALGLKADDLVLPISQGLFNAVPAEPPLVAPVIAGVGERPQFAQDKPLTVGTILTARDLAGQKTYYAALPDGVQQVSLTAATMIRAANPQVGTEPVEVGPDELAAFPKSNQLAVSFYPKEAVQIVDADNEPVTCWSWSHHGDEPTSRAEVLTGRTLPLTPEQVKALVPMVSAPTSEGMTADQVYMPSTTGRFVQVTSAATDSRLRESYFWIADNGVRFGLDTSDNESGDVTLAALKLHYPVPAPWVVVSLFASGPTLSQKDALIRHDGVPPNPTVAGLDKKEVK
ncbi:type VII secretion protein EccB [Mycolicibacterium fortuitum]|uniref:Type VII secretion protein EccB n=2 Tax=Mycolicibacterium fortuitum TaxID=1766 RepID=A0AAE4VH10_MYCFO|nr:type VII secretion protein EccB [Mycolicibacterium fortuitum]MCV7142580.1 type VII secretion protein EccB [Mycolicibacterium fortuitum]MDV7193704.1 type VII secretion protein EccB [Mycolicibacterium fortuitum]MDV7207113.1 type VII secretion protein EccB [Mycolicibacterium fortuitum]MDV7228624.1 type VII secretion protein EccB [Mycolicibacterium fortuitum]MDV7260612.1 type VII secretion protein EccB [Mycolicibacterium fortuitum]